MKYYCKNCGSIVITGTGYSLPPDEEYCHGNEHLCPVCERYMMKIIPDYETPAQYEKRTGKEFPDDGAVWKKHKYFSYWECVKLWQAKEELEKTYANYVEYVVIADPAIPPPKNWKPEEEV
jgi:hypothetical protein